MDVLIRLSHRNARIWSAALMMAAMVAAQPAWAGPKFHCEKPTYEAGDVWEGAEIEHTFAFRNDGDETLEILKVTPGCGCTLTGEYDKRVEPGKTGKIPIQVRTNRLRSLNKRITVETNDPTQKTVYLFVKGNLTKRIEVKPSATPFSWGRITSDTELTKVATVINNTKEKMTLELDKSPRPEPYKVTLKELEPGKKVEITVEVDRSKLKDGQNSSNLRLKTGLESEPMVMIPVIVYQPPIVELKRKILMVQAEPVTDTPLVLPVQYNGEGTMKLSEARSSHPDLATEILAMETDPGRLFQVTVTVPAGWSLDPGDKAELTLITDVKGSETIDVPIRVIQPRRDRSQQLVGRQVPDIAVMDETGSKIQLGAEQIDQVTVVNFWASWCGHSNTQLPMVQQLYALYRNRGVGFVNVATDRLTPPAEIKEAARQLGVTMPLAFDPESVAAKRFGAGGNGSHTPILFLVSKEGIVEAAHRGGHRAPETMKQMQETVVSQLDTLLAGKTRNDFDDARRVVPGQVCTNMEPPKATQGPVLVTDALRQDVGRIKPGQDFTYKLYIKNAGDAKLTIEKILPTEPITIGKGAPEVVDPGETTFIPCVIPASTKVGPFTRFVRIFSNDSRRPQYTISLAGEVRPYLEPDPPTGIEFGDRVPTHQMPRMATVLYNGPDEIEYLSAETSSDQFTATVQTMGKGPHGMVIVKAHPPFEVGEHQATITVKTTCKQQESVTLPVHLSMPPRIEVDPRIVSLRQTPRVQRVTVMIKNNGESSFHLLGIDASDEKIRTQAVPLPNGRHYRLELTLQPNYVTDEEGETITLRTDDEEMKEIVIPVHVAGNRSISKR